MERARERRVPGVHHERRGEPARARKEVSLRDERVIEDLVDRVTHGGKSSAVFAESWRSTRWPRPPGARREECWNEDAASTHIRSAPRHAPQLAVSATAHDWSLTVLPIPRTAPRRRRCTGYQADGRLPILQVVQLAGGRMSRTSLVAMVVIAAVGLLVAGVAIHGDQHGWETSFIWCVVLACVYAAVLIWMVDAAGLIRVMLHSRRCSCERRFSTTAAYVGGHARGCTLAERNFPVQRPAGPTGGPVQQTRAGLGRGDLDGVDDSEGAHWRLATTAATS